MSETARLGPAGMEVHEAASPSNKVTLRRPGDRVGNDALDHVEDRLLPLKQTVRHPLDPRTTFH
jgi:hypothetical protein